MNCAKNSAALCQRWRAGRERYRPAGEVFDTTRASVAAIDEATAKAFVTGHHYSGSYPAARFRAGLFMKDRFHRDRLAGVTVFSVPMSQHIIPRYFPIEPNEGVELGRLVLLDDVAANAESWFVARAFRLLKVALPTIQGVLSYSDPVPRTSSAGAVVKRGHIGTVYQALNAAYRGRSSSRTLTIAPDGREVSHRALSKLRTGDSGEAYAYQQLRAMGAPERQPFEDGASYVARALKEGGFRRQPHPGNHTYTWWLGNRSQRPAWEENAYPKLQG